MRTSRYLPLLLLASAITATAGAQGRSMQAIPQSAYEGWKQIGGATLTNDGKWAVYTLMPQVGEGTLVARSTTGTTEYRQARGYVSRPNLTVAGGSFSAPPAVVTSDSRYVVFSIEAPRAAIEKARLDKIPANRSPKASLGIMDLASGQVTTIARVRSFRVPRDRGSVVAYIAEPDSGAAGAADDSSSAAGGGGGGGRGGRGGRGGGGGGGAGGSATASGARKDPGNTLVVRNLASGTEDRIADVTSYAFTDSGSALVYFVSSRDGATDGAYVRSVPGGNTTTLVSGAGRYQSLTLDRAGKQVAFLTDKDEYPKSKARYTVYYASPLTGAAKVAVKHDAVGNEMIVAPNATVQFSHTGDALLFGVGPVPIEALSADSLAERAVFDLWSYKDQDLQPAQQVAAAQLRAPWFMAAYWPSASKWAKIGNDSAPDIRMSEDGKVGLAVSDYPYRIQGMWGDERMDLFLVDATTGEWKPIKKNMPSTYGWGPAVARAVAGSDVVFSPQGKYVLMFEKNQWSSYNVATGKTVNLTAGIVGAHFEDEEDDHPKAKSSLGVSGWSTGDERVLLNDRYDLWSVDPTGATPAKNLTGGVGRAKHIIFRVGRIERNDDPAIDLTKPLWLTATDRGTKDTGIWSVDASGKPQKVVMMAKRFVVSTKAKNAEVYLATESTFREFPDLLVGPSITSLTKITNANPQQANYRWGSAELVHFTSTNGVRLAGILYKPDGFDPKKKYPMMVDIYERLSDGLNNYIAPAPTGSSAANAAVYTSKGYLVLKPDIVYIDGHPGKSAVAAVVPAVQSLIDSGFVDAKHVGLVGHSWGGYEAAYIPTQTKIFAAVAPGALVANMSSAYGGIRWQQGVNRAWQYETHQSRVGATPWGRPDLYVENSALFSLNKITAPILMMANDNDGAVPWYQGIEMYIGLRRLGKEAYMFDYNGDSHGAVKRANTVDWDMRMQQFFDHHLMGAPAPEWMNKGIPYVKKGRDQSPQVITPVITP